MHTQKKKPNQRRDNILIWQASKCSPDMSPSLHMNFPFRSNMKRLREGIFDALFYSAADRREGNFTPLCKWFILSVSASHLETFSPSVTVRRRRKKTQNTPVTLTVHFIFTITRHQTGRCRMGCFHPTALLPRFSCGWNVFKNLFKVTRQNE